jgi:hypothetical protein
MSDRRLIREARMRIAVRQAIESGRLADIFEAPAFRELDDVYIEMFQQLSANAARSGGGETIADIVREMGCFEPATSFTPAEPAELEHPAATPMYFRSIDDGSN